METTPKELNLQVTIDEANLILEALGNLPFKQVFSLVGKIQQQASQQLSGEDVKIESEAQ